MTTAETPSKDTITVEQALQKAITHLQSGNLQDAERLYRAILEVVPHHPDANHNLGVLTTQVQHSAAALPYFKLALEANPNVLQYWLSYIDALIHSGYMDIASQTLEQAIQIGLKGEEVDTITRRIAAQPSTVTSTQTPATPSSKEMEQLVTLFNQHRYAEAETLALEMTGRYPDHGFGWKVLGAALKQQGNVSDSLIPMQKAAELSPLDADAHSNLGVVLKNLGRLAEAEASYRKALQIKPDYAEALSNLGVALRELQCLEEAEACYRKALQIEPDFAEAHNNLGNTLRDLDRLEEAEANYRSALQIKPDHLDAHFNLGNTLRDLGCLEEAEASFHYALAINPDFAEAHNNLGNTLRDLDHLEEAEASYRSALQIKPDFVEANYNLGNTLRDLGRLEEAETYYRKALQIKPDYAEAYSILGNTLRDLGRLEEAEASYYSTLQIRPYALKYAIQYYLLLPTIIGSKSEIDFWRDRYKAGIENLRNMPGTLENPGNNCNPLMFYLAYHNHNDCSMMKDLAQLFRTKIKELTATAAHIRHWLPPTGSDRRIRVGFLSQFLVDHTIGNLNQGFIHHLDRNRFEVVVIHLPNSRQGDSRHTIDKLADEVITLPIKLIDQQQAVAAKKLDVLFYPDIGMSPASYFLAYSRLAPVQAVTWGHPDTTGLDTMDYFLSVSSFEPEGSAAYYAETLIRFNRLNCFYEPPMASEHVASRTSLGLPETGALYGCPQSLFKFHPDFDAVLAAIAEGDPSGYIILLEGKYPELAGLLKTRWHKSSPILLDRVLFMPRMPRNEFMDLQARMDVLLDPLYFGGGNTFYEAMVYGTPMITCPGPFMRSRIAAGGYWQMGVADAPVVSNLAEYVSLALALGRDPERRQALRQASVVAAKRELFSDMLAVREFEDFLEAAVKAASLGTKLPINWRPEIRRSK